MNLSLVRYLCVVSLLSAATIGCTDKKAEAANQTIAEAKKAVERLLTDPSSVQYRDLKIHSEDVVCGEVNAKNRLGGYVGFRSFIYNGDDFGQAQLNVVPSQTQLWCSDESQKRATSVKRQSDQKWIALVVREQMCADAQDPMKKSIACDMADSARRDVGGKVAVPPNMGALVADAEKSTVEAEAKCAKASDNSPEKRVWCEVATKGREAVNRAKQK